MDEPPIKPGFVAELLANGRQDIYQFVRELVDELILLEAMRHCKGNQSEAARVLGLSRATLRSKLKRLWKS